MSIFADRESPLNSVDRDHHPRRRFLAMFAAPALAIRPAHPPTLTGRCILNGFRNDIAVIPPGLPLPEPSDSPGRSVVLVPMSDGSTLAMTETGPTAALVERWEGYERGERFQRLGYRYDRVTGEIVGGVEGGAL